MTRRWPALVLIPALLVAAVMLDRRSEAGSGNRMGNGGPAGLAADADLSRAMAVAAPAGAVSSTWFCAGGTATGDGAAEHVVVIANPTAVPVTGSITAVPSTGRARSRPVRVAAYGRTVVALVDLARAPFVAAVVEVDRGEVAVEHQVSGPKGVDAAPCATSGSDTWYFASGATTRDADETLVLFNPFAEDASVDITFATPDGRRAPAAFRGLQVPARSVVAARITPVVTVRAQLSTAVVARSGRVVVDRLQTYDGRGASTTKEGAAEETYRPTGLTVTPGSPRPSTTWMFPVGVKEAGAHERYVVYNPSSRQAEVDVVVTLDSPERNGEIDPFQLTVAPFSAGVIDLDAEDRVPTRVGHTAVVVSRNDVGVVAERLLAGTRPFSTIDTAASPGSSLAAHRWVFAIGGNVKGRQHQSVVLQNPSARSVVARIAVLGDGRPEPIAGLDRVTIEAFGRASVDLTTRVDEQVLSLLVDATGPIVAERLLVRLRGVNLSTAVGIPLPSGVVALTPADAGG